MLERARTVQECNAGNYHPVAKVLAEHLRCSAGGEIGCCGCCDGWKEGSSLISARE